MKMVEVDVSHIGRCIGEEATLAMSRGVAGQVLKYLKDSGFKNEEAHTELVKSLTLLGMNCAHFGFHVGKGAPEPHQQPPSVLNTKAAVLACLDEVEEAFKGQSMSARQGAAFKALLGALRGFEDV